MSKLVKAHRGPINQTTTLAQLDINQAPPEVRLPLIDRLRVNSNNYALDLFPVLCVPALVLLAFSIILTAFGGILSVLGAAGTGMSLIYLPFGPPLVNAWLEDKRPKRELHHYYPQLALNRAYQTMLDKTIYYKVKTEVKTEEQKNQLTVTLYQHPPRGYRKVMKTETFQADETVAVSELVAEWKLEAEQLTEAERRQWLESQQEKLELEAFSASLNQTD